MRMDTTPNSIINGREADLLIYGEIVNNSYDDDEKLLGKSIVQEILTLSNSCDRIRVHINSEGGEVYAGIAIFNAIRTCTKDITIYTDGISASIAGIIAMCGRKHYMSRYARLMIHSVSAGVYGDKNELMATVDEIRSLENTLAEIIGNRIKCTPEEVKARYFDGTDHWFTAQEAVDAGLADGIYDIGVEADEKGTPENIYRTIFTNRAAIRTQISRNMDITKFQQMPLFANAASEEDVLKTVESLLGQVERLETENEQLRERLKQIEEEDIEKILDAAVSAGKIEEGEKDDYRTLLNSNRAAAEKVLSSLKGRRQVKNDISNTPQKKSGYTNWDDRMEEIRSRRAAR